MVWYGFSAVARRILSTVSRVKPRGLCQLLFNNVPVSGPLERTLALDAPFASERHDCWVDRELCTVRYSRRMKMLNDHQVARAAEYEGIPSHRRRRMG